MSLEFAALVQARMGSTRLPGKILKKLGKYSVLEWVIKRLKRSKYLDAVIVVTSKRFENNQLSPLVKKNKAILFKGDEANVLSRYYFAAKKLKVKNIIRVCADNPFVDPDEIDQLIKSYKSNNKVYTFNHKNYLKFKFADGFGAEIFPFSVLKQIYKLSFKKKHLEHVTSYIWDNKKNFIIKPANSKVRNNFRKIKADINTVYDYKKLLYLVKKFKIRISSPSNVIIKYLKKIKSKNFR
jgi:spore coat polysaccharide biosynthesis protein SpsF